MRLPWPQLAGGAAVVAAGVAGLVYAVVPSSPGDASAGGVGEVTIADAYVRAPLPGQTSAAAYFTVDNTTNRPDRVVSVETGAGASAELHNAQMTAMTHPVVVPAHGSLTLHTGGMHVMIEKLFGPLTKGQTVNIEVDFAHAGAIDVVAKVIPYGATPPGAGGNSQ